jgi:hypothetical protein
MVDIINSFIGFYSEMIFSKSNTPLYFYSVRVINESFKVQWHMHVSQPFKFMYELSQTWWILLAIGIINWADQSNT